MVEAAGVEPASANRQFGLRAAGKSFQVDMRGVKMNFSGFSMDIFLEPGQGG